MGHNAHLREVREGRNIEASPGTNRPPLLWQPTRGNCSASPVGRVVTTI
ncbi:hypothetical protein KCP75_01585 [Salmonella enterica subsp. enterica]|nr:hypothetical protein KCP75_01585 [Salmonella enterica subsp. enterica]